jgi:hypothetical protein
MTRRLAAVLAVGALAVAPTATASPAGSGGGPTPPPKVNQLVVFRDGSFKEKITRAKRVSVRIGGKRCVVGAGTPLAALVASRVAKIGLRDFGSCSSRARDAAGLFVRKLGPDANAGQNGWVYKVGRKSATAGAADPGGPFGHGRLKFGAHVLWFYCVMQRSGGCQRTLSFDQIVTEPPGGLVVHVGAYNDQAKGIPAVGVIVHVGSATATTDTSGVARVVAVAGKQKMFAEGGGFVRSFDTTVEVQ